MPDVNVRDSLAGASTTPYWLDSPLRPAPRTRLSADTETDLVVVGGGFTGLWTALMAKERDPDRRVLLIEGARIGWAASGRNGGFASASLTHGRENGLARFPSEIDRLDQLGAENLDQIEETLARYDIDCDFERTGTLSVAVQPHQVEWLREASRAAPGGHAGGIDVEGSFLDETQIRGRVDSPTYLAAAYEPNEALVDPARLAWGLADAAERLGVTVVEDTRITRLKQVGDRLNLTTDTGLTVSANRAALGTNAFAPLLHRLRFHTIPVYDYVLVTEPLTNEQLSAVGWKNREGISDIANQFHYYRLTRDNRILWGGYDAVYYFGRDVKAKYDQRPATATRLAEHFFTTFPQLHGVKFTHVWGGAIDTCTRFFAFYGTAMRGRVAYATGYTGLGVAATRFGANVMLDLLSGEETERIRLDSVRRRPLPFPPEPFAWLGVTATRAALAAADRNEGRRNLWLRTLDRLGLGFDS